MFASARWVSPLISSVSACACGLLFVLGVMSYHAADRELPPGTIATMRIEQVANTEQEALHLLQQAAENNEVNLIRVGANPAGPDSDPWYFAFIGDRPLFDATYPDGNYPAFWPSTVPQIYPGAELGEKNQPIRGLYAIQGTQQGGSAVAAELTASGLPSTTAAVGSVNTYVVGLVRSSLWPLLITVVIALALAIIHWVASSRKTSALQEFHGFSRVRIVLTQTAGLLAVFGVAMLLAVGVGSLFLFLLNGGSQYGLFLPWALFPMLGLGFIAVATQLLASVVVLRLPGYAALRGARPRRLLGIAAGGSQAVMLILVFAAVAQATGGAILFSGDARSFQEWDNEQNSICVQINPHAFEDPATNIFEPEVAAAYKSFGSIFAEMDKNGTAVLSMHSTNQDTDNPDASLKSYTPLQGNSMIVNNNYLRRHRITDMNGARIPEVPPTASEISLLIPARLASQQDSLVAQWAESTVSMTDPITNNEPTRSLSVKPVLMADNQQLFTYGSTQNMEQWVQTSPVVAVISPESHFLSDYMLLGVAANNGNVIFTDGPQFRERSAAAGLTERFSGVSSPATHAAQQLRERHTKLVVAIGTAAIGLITLTIAVSLLAAIYADTIRFSSFLRRIHGRSALHIHWLFLASVICASVLMILTAFTLSRMLNLATESTLIAVALCLICLISASLILATSVLDQRARAALITRR